MTLFSEKSREKQLEKKVKEADLRIAGFVAEHNLPILLMDHFWELLGAICSDSLIAKNIKCGRTNIKSILTNVTGETARDHICFLMNINKFSIIVDESTDRSCIKNLAVVVRVNCNNKTIKDYFLALIPVHETTGEAIFQHIIQLFYKYKISYQENCIGFASDGANNMMGIHNSVRTRMVEAIHNLFVMKSVCHSFHLCASYACEQLPAEIEKFTRDVYNYFSNSPKRIGDYKKFQNFRKCISSQNSASCSYSMVITRKCC